MPNAKVLSEKQAIVAGLTEQLKNAAAGVLVDYKGITVAEDTALRAELRKNNVEYAVVKNTLLRFAVDNCGMNELDSLPPPWQSAPMTPLRLPVSSTISPRSWKTTSRSKAVSWMARSCPLMKSWPWPQFPRCPFSRPRSWVLCWRLFPPWLSYSSRPLKNRALPLLRMLPLPLSKRRPYFPLNFIEKLLGGT